jgi:hypothetical protein
VLLAVPLTATVAVSAVSGSFAFAGTPPQAAKSAPASAQAAPDGLVPKPYMGWSSWSQQATTYPGNNPRGKWSWLNEAAVLRQADAMASKLKKFGYQYINIDAGWWHTYDWQSGFDANGRQKVNTERFPRGMKFVADYIHGKGLKAGIYLPVGLEKPALGNFPIAGAPGCTTQDIVYADKRTTNGWDSSYKIDFAKPCAQKYIDSQARMIVGWGYDFIKIDGVGSGSDKRGPNYDNRPDIAAWSEALRRTGRPVILQLSWSLDINYVNDWKKWAHGARINGDVETYGPTLVGWQQISWRFRDYPAWAQHSGPGFWADLDSLNVGNGQMDGLTHDERQTTATLWAVSSTPWYLGDDLTKLDSYGLSLVTNPEVLAVNQQGRPARPVRTSSDQQVYYTRNTDGSYTVALFNLGPWTSNVTVHWRDLGIVGPAKVRDLWARNPLGTINGSFSASLPSHGSRLLRIAPTSPAPATTGWVSAQSGRCLDVYDAHWGNGTPLNIWDCHGGTNQNWTVSSDGEFIAYGDKCLDVPGNPGNGTRVVVWDCNGGDNQKWDLKEDGTIRARASGLCLDVMGSTNNGAAVGVYACNGGPNQRWSRR